MAWVPPGWGASWRADSMGCRASVPRDHPRGAALLEAARARAPARGDYPRAAPQLRLVRGNLGRLLDALCAKCHREPQRLRPWSRLGTKVEVFMTTVIDVIVLLLAYAGLSLSCAGLIWLLRRLPHGHSHEGPTNRAW
jgi:hypothetical protein